MLISRHLNVPCPKCNFIGKYGNISVDRNILNRGCNNCQKRIRLPLPEIRKKIIYLDQFFLSHAFRNKEQPFVDAANRIKDMAIRQLVVCPYSSVHTDETHLWRDEQRESLYEFIKQVACGNKFNEAFDIKQKQMQRSFDAFRSNLDLVQAIEDSDAFCDEIHQWNGYSWVDMLPVLGDLEAIRQGKSDAISNLVNLFPGWKNLTTTFEEDVETEAVDYWKLLFYQYFHMVMTSDGNNIDYPMDSMYVESLLRCDRTSIEIDERLKRIGRFFCSPYFTNIPNVRISCEIFAVLRKMVKNGAYTNAVKARRKLAGLFYDSDCISVFGPYSDAIFIDKSMKQWLENPEVKSLESHNTKVFSVENWNDFHIYLDKIEENYTEDIREAMSWAYPNIHV